MHSLAELIYSAWVEAGSPAFGTNTSPSDVSTALKSNISVYPNPTSGKVNLIGDNIIITEVFSITGSSLGNYYSRQIDLNHLRGCIS